jgi:pimeloyl-ACP methyl ester carboxylesterase
MKSPRILHQRAARLAVGGAALAVVAAIVPATTAFAAKGAGSSAGSGHPAAVKPTVVLVPGAWADGSSWDGVVADLQHDGYTVDVPPNPLSGVASDSAYLAGYLATVSGPVVLVGQSYGGFVITNAATGDTNIKALVYVDAFIPAQGETLNQLTDQFPGSQVTQAALNFVPEPGGVTDVYIKPADFRAVLANDDSPAEAAELAATQRPLAASALTEPSGTPAWLTIPSWDVIGTEDHAIPVAAQEYMARRAGSAVTKIDAAHFSMVSHPDQVTDVIETAARHVS